MVINSAKFPKRRLPHSAQKLTPPRILNEKTGNNIPVVPLGDLVLRVVTLAQTICEKKFYPYQVQFTYRLVESILLRDGETITALLSRQSGKTEGIGGIILAILIVFPMLSEKFKDDYRFNLTDDSGRYRGFKNGIKIGIYAPKLEQAEVMFERVKSFLDTKSAQQTLKELKLTVEACNGNTLRFSSGSRLICQTASDNAKIEGETHHLLVLEEAQDLSDLKIKKSLRPMVASTRGTICMIGTATTKRCTFYDMIKHNERSSLAGSQRNHFFYPHNVCSQYNSLYADYIEQEKVRLGENSDEFQMSYGCRWIFERGMFITQEQLFSVGVAYGRTELFSETLNMDLLRRLPTNFGLVAGIDWGSVHDSTVITLLAVDWLNPLQSIRTSNEFGEFTCDLYRKHVVGWKEWLGDNYETQFNEISNFLFMLGLGLKKIVTDSNTCGKPIYDRLVATFAAQDTEIVPFNFSGRTKSDGYKALYGELLGKRISIPAGVNTRQTTEYRKFVNQMLDLRKSYKNGLMVVAHPDEKNAHDDYPDSLMMANWGSLTAPMDSEVDFADANPFFR